MPSSKYLDKAQSSLGQIGGTAGGGFRSLTRRKGVEDRLRRAMNPKDSAGSFVNQKLAQYTTGNSRQAYTHDTDVARKGDIDAENKPESEVQTSVEGLGQDIQDSNKRLMQYTMEGVKRRKLEEKKRREEEAKRRRQQQNSQGGMYQGKSSGGSVATSYRGPTTVIDGMKLGQVAPGKYLRHDAAGGFKAMASAFARAGMGNLGVTAGFRSNARQQYLYNLYKSGRGNLAAPPGQSLHQSGIAVDLNGYGGGTGTAQFRWLLQNAGKYGFSWANGRRYGEPWHWEYVR